MWRKPELDQSVHLTEHLYDSSLVWRLLAVAPAAFPMRCNAQRNSRQGSLSIRYCKLVWELLIGLITCSCLSAVTSANAKTVYFHRAPYNPAPHYVLGMHLIGGNPLKRACKLTLPHSNTVFSTLMICWLVPTNNMSCGSWLTSWMILPRKQQPRAATWINITRFSPTLSNYVSHVPAI